MGQIVHCLGPCSTLSKFHVGRMCFRRTISGDSTQTPWHHGDDWNFLGGTMPKFILALAVITSLTGCAAIPFAVGAAGAVVADEAMERQNGDDGLF